MIENEWIPAAQTDECVPAPTMLLKSSLGGLEHFNPTCREKGPGALARVRLVRINYIWQGLGGKNCVKKEPCTTIAIKAIMYVISQALNSKTADRSNTKLSVKAFRVLKMTVYFHKIIRAKCFGGFFGRGGLINSGFQ